MRPLVDLDDMIPKRDVLEGVFNSFRSSYNELAEINQGKISGSDFNELIITTIEPLTGEDKEVAEGFLEFLVGFMFMFESSIECFEAVAEIFEWN